jgi:hypothetical protein
MSFIFSQTLSNMPRFDRAAANLAAAFLMANSGTEGFVANHNVPNGQSGFNPALIFDFFAQYRIER